MSQKDFVLGSKRSQENDDNSRALRSKERRINIDLTEDDNEEPADEEFQVIPFPEISMVESRIDSKSRESTDMQQSSSQLKISDSHSLSNFSSFDFHSESNQFTEVPAKNSNANNEFPNELVAWKLHFQPKQYRRNAGGTQDLLAL